MMLGQSTLFFFIAEQYIMVWMYHVLSAGRHLSYFQFGNSGNKAAMKIYVQVFKWSLIFIFLR